MKMIRAPPILYQNPMLKISKKEMIKINNTSNNPIMLGQYTQGIFTRIYIEKDEIIMIIICDFREGQEGGYMLILPDYGACFTIGGNFEQIYPRICNIPYAERIARAAEKLIYIYEF